jgi:hypothetical protein
MNVEETKAYKCTNCGNAYLDKEFAEKCCQPKHCEDCGKELPYRWYKTVCESCDEKRYFDKSVKMTIEEYNEKYPNNMVFYNDEYYLDVYSCLESLFDNYDSDDEVKELVDNLEYIYGTECDEVKLDGDSIIEQMEHDSGLDEFRVDDAGYKELNDFLLEWNKKYGAKCYFQDKIAILIPRELREEYAR